MYKWIMIISIFLFSGCLVDNIEEDDTIKPIVNIIGKNPDTINVGESFIDSGAVATDNNDGNLTSKIITVNNVDTTLPGSYTISYTVSDEAGNMSSDTRIVLVLDKNKPTISIKGNNPDTSYLGYSYIDSGATAIDLVDGDLTDSIKVVSNVDTSSLGNYSIIYIVSNGSGNSDTAIREVTIIDKPARSVYIFETDYTTGNIGMLNNKNEYTSLQTIYDDGSIYSFKNDLYILEAKGADNIVKMDKVGNVIYQKHLIDNANPQDIKFLNSNKAYVSCYAFNFLLVIDPSTGGIIDSISIDGFADTSSTTPFPKSMVLSGTNLFIVLQRLTSSFGYVNNSIILKIDTNTDEIIDTLFSSVKNAGAMIELNDKLYVSSTGTWNDVTDGAIEEFDLTTGVVKTIISEADVNSQITGVQEFDNKLLVNLQVYDASWNLTAKIIVVDPITGTVTDTLEEVTEPGPAIYDNEKDRLFISERSVNNAGVHIWENGTYLKKVTTDIAPNGFVFLTE